MKRSLFSLLTSFSLATEYQPPTNIPAGIYPTNNLWTHIKQNIKFTQSKVKVPLSSPVRQYFIYLNKLKDPNDATLLERLGTNLDKNPIWNVVRNAQRVKSPYNDKGTLGKVKVWGRRQESGTLTDETLQSYLDKYLSEASTHGRPLYEKDRNGMGSQVYTFIATDELTIEYEGLKSCRDFCGYHATFERNGENVHYQVVVNPYGEECTAACTPRIKGNVDKPIFYNPGPTVYFNLLTRTILNTIPTSLNELRCFGEFTNIKYGYSNKVYNARVPDSKYLLGSVWNAGNPGMPMRNDKTCVGPTLPDDMGKEDGEVLDYGRY